MANITPSEYWRFRLRNYAFAHKGSWRSRILFWLLSKKERE
jgi:hypothetical protein